MTSRFTSAHSASCEISGLCWVETTMAVMRLGRPSTYSTLTCDLPSGRRKSTSPWRRTSLSRCTSLWASMMGSGISSGVSSQA